MTKVLATGVFNILHPGHIFYLSEAKKLGDELIVIVSSDAMASKISQKKVLPAEQRAKVVEALNVVGKVFIGDDEDIMALMPVILPDVIALGHDQDVDETWLKERLMHMGISPKLIRISRSLPDKLYSTRNIIKALC